MITGLKNLVLPPVLTIGLAKILTGRAANHNRRIYRGRLQ